MQGSPTAWTRRKKSASNGLVQASCARERRATCQTAGGWTVNVRIRTQTPLETRRTGAAVALDQVPNVV
jgi:hypothetical protein